MPTPSTWSRKLAKSSVQRPKMAQMSGVRDFALASTIAAHVAMLSCASAAQMPPQWADTTVRIGASTVVVRTCASLKALWEKGGTTLVGHVLEMSVNLVSAHVALWLGCFAKSSTTDQWEVFKLWSRLPLCNLLWSVRPSCTCFYGRDRFNTIFHPGSCCCNNSQPFIKPLWYSPNPWPRAWTFYSVCNVYATITSVLTSVLIQT